MSSVIANGNGYLAKALQYQLPNFYLHIGPTKPSNIIFTDQGTATDAGRLRRKYRVSWDVSLHNSNISRQFE